MKRNVLARIIAISLAIITVFSSFTITALAATNPSLGNCPANVTLYNNTDNNDNLSRTYIIPVKNYDRNCSYHVKSANKNTATVSGTANSKTGITITIKAKSRGNTTITVYINKNGKTITSKSIKVTVYPASISTPKNLTASNINKNSFKLTWGIDSTKYLTTYRVQYSTDNRNWKTYCDTRYANSTLNNLSSKTRYYVRILAISNLADGSYINTISPVVRVIAK